LPVRLDSPDGCVRKLLVEAACHHRARGDEVAVNDDVRPADREVGEALAQRGEVRLDFAAVEDTAGLCSL
jgi:plasmid stability protein